MGVFRGAFLVLVGFNFLESSVDGTLLKKLNTNWDRLAVTYGKFYRLPITACGAKQLKWWRDASCPAPTRSFPFYFFRRHHRFFNFYKPKALFPGNRYVLGTDKTTRVLYGADNLVVGLQATIPAPVGGGPHAVIPPWAVKDKYGNLLFTAYFKDPRKVCSRRRSCYDIIGDRLWILIDDKQHQNSSFLKIPLERKDLNGTKWVEGSCFNGMGIHYWYDISPNMDCNNFYPVFLLYGKQDGRLKAFGWSFGTFQQGDRWEHPKGDQIKFFFNPKTLPRCLLKMQTISTQHVYLSDWQNLKC